MELTNKEGGLFVMPEELKDLRHSSLEVRKTIIVYNKTKDEVALNKCCRLCNRLLSDIDKVLNGGGL